jgi:hypothetical protein
MMLPIVIADTLICRLILSFIASFIAFSIACSFSLLIDHPLSGANVYNYLNVNEPFHHPQDSATCPPASSIRWPATSQQTVAGNLMLQRVPRLALGESQSSAQRQGCDCLGALVKVLENISKSQTQAEWTGIDMQLMSFWQAIHTCQQVIGCNTC